MPLSDELQHTLPAVGLGFLKAYLCIIFMLICQALLQQLCHTLIDTNARSS